MRKVSSSVQHVEADSAATIYRRGQKHASGIAGIAWGSFGQHVAADTLAKGISSHKLTYLDPVQLFLQHTDSVVAAVLLL